MPRNKKAAEQPVEELPEVPGPDATLEEVEVEQTGDGGARAEEVTAAQAAFDAMHTTLDLGVVAGGVVRNATDWVVELFKHRPKPFDALSRDEQRDLIRGIEENVHELVRQVVEAVAANGTDPVRCLFVGFTDKGDDIKGEIKLKAMSKEGTEKAVLFFHRARGQHVMVTLASAAEFHAEPAVDRSEPDQRALGFEAGSDEITLDEGEDEDEAVVLPEGGRGPLPEDTTEVVHTGDNLIIGQIGFCEARVNLKTSMLEALRPGELRTLEDSWFDVRAASPAELADERARTADFADAD